MHNPGAACVAGNFLLFEILNRGAAGSLYPSPQGGGIKSACAYCFLRRSRAAGAATSAISVSAASSRHRRISTASTG
jgi:hypothetical protein